MNYFVRIIMAFFGKGQTVDVEVEKIVIVEKIRMIDECEGYGQKETSRRAVDYQFAGEVRIQIVCKGE